MKRGILLFTALMLAAGLGRADDAPAKDPAKDDDGPAVAYGVCMAQAREHAEAALKLAKAMHERGTTAPARHCRATALLALGRSTEAAQELDALGEIVTGAPAGERAELAAQAGRAWLESGDAGKAAAAFGRALALKPDDTALLLARAVARGAAGKEFEALDDLNRVVEIAPDRADARVLRAAAYRRVDAPELAQEDLRIALRLNPKLADAWLELGLLRAGRGDIAGAGAALKKAIRLDPGGATGSTAQGTLDRLTGAGQGQAAP